MKPKVNENRSFDHRNLFVYHDNPENQERITPAARQLTRKRVKAKAKIYWEGGYAEGDTDNMNLKGAYIRTSSSVPVHQMISVELSVSDESQPAISAAAQVVRSDDNGIGVEFKNLSLKTHADLHAFVVALGGR